MFELLMFVTQPFPGKPANDNGVEQECEEASQEEERCPETWRSA